MPGPLRNRVNVAENSSERSGAILEGFSEIESPGALGWLMGEVRNVDDGGCGSPGGKGFAQGNRCAARKGTSRERVSKSAGRDLFGPKYKVGMSADDAESRLKSVIGKVLKDKRGINSAA